ncbi:MAG: aldehyde dehydrogenase family protein [Thermoplasmataceae archaeon]
MNIETVNPYNGELVSKVRIDDENESKKIFTDSRLNQLVWKKDIDERIRFMKVQLIPNLIKNKIELANLMSKEMGKPITQSIAEIEKTILMIEYFMKNTTKFIADENVQTEASSSYIKFEPLGVIFLIMPWNYPLWQVARAAVPAMLAGNSIVLKHASIVSGTSKKIEEIFDTPLFRSVIVKGSSALDLIKYSDGVSFTGSTQVGTQIYVEAAKNIKKVVLELGGSDPFVVLESANIEKTAKNAVIGRLQNNGQSCIASKRFIVHEKIYEQFYEAMKEEFVNVKMGDQLDPETYLGPVSSNSQASIINEQISVLKTMGNIVLLGIGKNNNIPPTIAAISKPYDEEVFGPVAILRKFTTNADAIKMCNEIQFGLGASVWGEPSDAEPLINEIESGMVYVNKIVTSDPRLPFGGVKKSGIGRELSRYGMLEFTSKKTVWIQDQNH